MRFSYALITILGFGLSACGQQARPNMNSAELKSTSGPGISITKDSDPLETIGRGARITLTKDIEIQANRYMGIMEPQTIYIMSPNIVSEYKTVTIQCGISAKEKSLDRRVMPAGTVLELSGQWWRDPNGDATSHYLRENLGVSKPGEIASVTCQTYYQICTTQTGLCGGYYQSKMTIADFKTGLKSFATVEQASPVIIK